MAKVLIATLFEHKPVMFAVTKHGVDKLILLTDDEGKETQDRAFDTIKQALGGLVELERVDTKVYEIFEVAKKCVEIIDQQDTNDEISLCIASGRKPKALGVLFAGYARNKSISKIVYARENPADILLLPKMSFHISDNMKAVLRGMYEKKHKTMEELARLTGLSRPTLYRHVEELVGMDLLERKGKGYEITDAGRIVLL